MAIDTTAHLQVGRLTGITKVYVGTATRTALAPDDTSAINVIQYESAATSGVRLALLAYAEQTVATSGSIQAFMGHVVALHPSGTVAGVEGCGSAEHAGAGLVTDIHGGVGRVAFTGSGNATRANALYAPSVTKSGAGAPATAAGLRVAAQTVGTSLNYGVITEGTNPSTFGGSVLVGTTVATGSTAGDLVLPNSRDIRFVNSGGTNTFSAIRVDASSIRIGNDGVHVIAFGGPTSIASAAVKDLVLANNASLRAANAAGSSTVLLAKVDASNILGLGVTRTAASVPGAFSATHLIRVRDNAGNDVYLAGMSAIW